MNSAFSSILFPNTNAVSVDPVIRLVNNPIETGASFLLEYEGEIETDVDIQIFNTSGQLVDAHTALLSKGITQITNPSVGGVYYLVIEVKEEVEVFLVVVY